MSFFTGYFIDKYKLKLIVSISLIMQVILCLLIPVIVILNMSVTFIYIIAFLLPSFQIIFQTSINVLMPLLFHQDELQKFNSQFQGIRTISKLISPAVAGILLIYLSVNNLFILNAFSFLVLFIIFLFLSLPDNSSDNDSDENLKDLWYGFKYIYNNKVLKSVMLLLILINIAMVGFNSALVFYLKDFLKLGDDIVGIVYSFAGAGSLLASIYLNLFPNKISLGKLAIISNLSIPILIFISPIYPNWIYFATTYALISFWITIASICLTTVCQKNTEKIYLGKVFSAVYIITLSLSPIGAFIITGMNNFFNIQSSIFILSIFIFIISIIAIIKYKDIFNLYTEKKV